MFDTWYKAVAMLNSGLSIEPIISHRVESHEGSDVDRLASGHLSSGGWNLGFGLAV